MVIDYVEFEEELVQDLVELDYQEVKTDNPVLLQSSDYEIGRTGVKANCWKEVEELGLDFKIPESVAIPFGVFESLVLESMPSDMILEYRALLKELARGVDEELADQFTELICRIPEPSSGLDDLRRGLTEFGITADWSEVWQGLLKLWSSKYGITALDHYQRLEADHTKIYLSIIVQRLIVPDYSFLLHTVNTITRQQNEITGEICLGLGAGFKATNPGRVFKFIGYKEEGMYKITSFPNKSFKVVSEA
jgi:alpha-glucan,water dikinase